MIRSVSQKNLVCIASLIGLTTTAFVLSLTLGGAYLDDGFIYFRYVLNLTRGYGPVFNQGEFVEGFSSITYLLALAVVFLFCADLPWCSRVLGALGHAGTVVTCFFLVINLMNGDRKAVLAGLVAASMVAAAPQFVFYSGSGLETTVNALAITLALAMIVRPTRVITPTACGLAVMTRPENLALITALMMVGGILIPRGQRRSYLIKVALPYVILVASFLTLRFLLYGQLLANSALAKAGPISRLLSSSNPWAEATQLLEANYDYTAGFLSQMVSPLVWLGLLALVFSRHRSQLVLSMATIGFYMVFVFSTGGDWMPYYRYYAPLVPILSVAAGIGIIDTLNWARNRLGLSGTFEWLVVLAVCVYGLFVNLQQNLSLSIRDNKTRELITEWRQQSAELCSVLESNATIMTDIIGIVGYQCKDQIILDTAGLIHRVDRESLATGGIMGVDLFDWALERSPDFIITHYETMVLDRLLPSASIRNNYDLFNGYRLHDGVTWIAVRRDLIQPELQQQFASLRLHPAIRELPNGSFESGQLFPWEPRGAAFSTQPTKGDNTAARGAGRSNQVGDYWIGTFERHGSQEDHVTGSFQGDDPQGELTQEVVLGGRFLSFLVGGGATNVGVEVKLLDGTMVCSHHGTDSETMRRVYCDITQYSGQIARIRVFDQSSDPWGHVNVDDFLFINRYIRE